MITLAPITRISITLFDSYNLDFSDIIFSTAITDNHDLGHSFQLSRLIFEGFLNYETIQHSM